MAGKEQVYRGFEQGPIRPPSEAYSLLIRVSRNCPWNKCNFCFVYKGEKFSIRPAEHVKNDIDLVHKHIEELRRSVDSSGGVPNERVRKIAGEVKPDEIESFNAAVNWASNGMNSVFIQDANSLVIRAEYLTAIIRHLKKRFPWVKRITSYARSHSLARAKDENLKEIREAGLNRIHVGMESGSNKILKLINKGSSKEQHVEAGLKVKAAGIELSEYIMPGLGGKNFSELHALETADALNQIDPHFIRTRTLMIPGGYPLFGENSETPFEKSSDLLIAKEILLFLQNIEGINSTVKSDHMANLFQTVEGKLPEDKKKMMEVIESFLKLDPMTQTYFQVGRRFGFLLQVSDLEKPYLKEKVERICLQLGVTPDNVDQIIEEHVKRTM